MLDISNEAGTQHQTKGAMPYEADNQNKKSGSNDG